MGKKIENYCLEAAIGEGEFGRVYRATNEKTQQVVAIKVIRIEKYKMSPRLEEFTRHIINDGTLVAHKEELVPARTQGPGLPAGPP